VLLDVCIELLERTVCLHPSGLLHAGENNSNVLAHESVTEAGSDNKFFFP
jgi:hypothetical protein